MKARVYFYFSNFNNGSVRAVRPFVSVFLAELTVVTTHGGG